jgi:hypothetical protein
VLGRHVEQLKFLDVMFGDRPPLKPEELTYQRLLAGDPIEATEQAQQYLKDKPLLSYYQEVLVAALQLAQADADKGVLDEERTLRIRDTVSEIVDDLESWDDDKPLPTPEAPLEGAVPLPVEDTTPFEPVPEAWRNAKRVLCVPGLGPLDEAMALIVAQLIEKDGIGARVEGSGALSISRIFSLDTDDVAVICICYIGNATSAQIRYAIRRLRRKAPKAIILTALVGNSDIVPAVGEASGEDSEPLRSLHATVKRMHEIALTSQGLQLTAA